MAPFFDLLMHALIPASLLASQVEQAMRDSLYDEAKRAVEEYPRGREASIKRDRWLWDYPAQVKMRQLPPRESFESKQTVVA